MSALLWELPASWNWITFEQAAEIAANLVPTSAVQNLPHIAPDNIRGGDGTLLAFRTVAEDEVKSPKHRFYPGQVLYSKIRPYLRKAVIVDFDGVCSADMYPLNPREGVVATYLYYWMFSPQLAGFVLAHEGRTVLPKVNQTGLNQTPFPLPPEPEQRRIVAKLDSLRARSSRARHELDRIPKLIGRYKQAILAKAFSGELTADWRETNPHDALRFMSGAGIAQAEHDGSDQLPAGWYWAHAGEICSIKSGVALGKKRIPGTELIELPYLRVANVQRGWLNLNEIKTTQVTLREAEALYLQPGDVLMNEGGDRDKLGRGWVWEGQIERCIHQNHVFRLRPNSSQVPSRYISYYANEFGQRYFLDEGKQTTNLASISMSKVSALPIPICTPNEMAVIVQRIESACAWLDKIATEHARAEHLLPKLDQAILAKAFRGELVPQDPNDEPASVLLERIKAGRVGLEQSSRRRARSA